MRHPTFVVVRSSKSSLAFDLGELPEAEIIATADHLGECSRCRDRLTEALSGVSSPLLRDLRELAGTETFVSLAKDKTGASGVISSQHATGSWTIPEPAQRGSGTHAPGLGAAGPRIAIAGHNPPPASGSDADEPHALDMFGHYELFGKLGEGGMGVVFRGRDPRLKRNVALKMLKIGHASEEQRVRFMSEAEAVARLQHPNVVQIYDIGEISGHPYCALEFVPGGSLDRRIKDTLPDPQTAARLMIPIARGMQAAHVMKIVHRDLKPANILLTGDPKGSLNDCTAKVTDFGLAKFLDTEDG